MKVLGWLGLMGGIVMLGCLALALASPVGQTSTNRIEVRYAPVLVNDALWDLAQVHPFFLDHSSIERPTFERGADRVKATFEGDHDGGWTWEVTVEASPTGVTISESISTRYPWPERLGNLIWGAPEIRHFDRARLIRELKGKWDAGQWECWPYGGLELTGDTLKDDELSGYAAAQLDTLPLLFLSRPYSGPGGRWLSAREVTPTAERTASDPAQLGLEAGCDSVEAWNAEGWELMLALKKEVQRNKVPVGSAQYHAWAIALELRDEDLEGGTGPKPFSTALFHLQDGVNVPAVGQQP